MTINPLVYEKHHIVHDVYEESLFRTFVYLNNKLIRGWEFNLSELTLDRMNEDRNKANDFIQKEVERINRLCGL